MLFSGTTIIITKGQGQGTGKICLPYNVALYWGSFSYILLLLGYSKSFVIPRTSLYRGLLIILRFYCCKSFNALVILFCFKGAYNYLVFYFKCEATMILFDCCMFCDFWKRTLGEFFYFVMQNVNFQNNWRQIAKGNEEKESERN